MARNNSDAIFKVGNVADQRRQIRSALTAIIDEIGVAVLPSEFDTFKATIATARDQFDTATEGGESTGG